MDSSPGRRESSTRLRRSGAPYAGGGRLRRRVLHGWVAAVSLGIFVRPAAAAPEIGILQFQVEHNLEDSGCLSTGSCFIHFEAPGDPSAWLAEIRQYSNLAILHWDRGVPWLVFDVDPPLGSDRVPFYDAALDTATRTWIDAFEAHFATLGRGYLAVSLLSSERDRLASLYVDAQTQIPFATACPDFSPGSQIVVDPGTGPTQFDLARSYRNFLLYLAEKLEPDYFALMVEVNFVEQTCPARAAGLYALYRAMHDEVEAALAAAPPLFATLSLPRLLAYQREACYPTSVYEPCAAPDAPPAPDAGVEACYPIDRGAIDELDLGGRLDVLALSFYPDGLETNRVAGGDPESRVWPLADWNAGAACTAKLDWPESVDPVAAIDRLGWTGPVAMAESSARACASPLRVDLPPANDPYVIEVPGSPESQAAWVEHMLQAANQRDFLFYAHAFLRDYPPIGPWIVQAGIAPPSVQALINIWPCSGLQDASGQLKPALAPFVVPEPEVDIALGFGFSGLLAGRLRRRAKGRNDAPRTRTEQT